MCGIAGLLRFDGGSADPETLVRMTDVLSHRGPDEGGLWTEGAIGLGHRRLAILDPSPGGRQPMSNEAGTVRVTYNGEIYNYLELRGALEARGHVFRSTSDTEVLVKAYEEWGTACLERLNGIFAFGLWDARRRALWLVRDRIGVKPLFYSLDEKEVAFASEIKGILEGSRAPIDLDLRALAFFLSFNYTPAPHTLVRRVRQLLPGRWLWVEHDGKSREEEYWRLALGERRRVASVDEVAGEFSDLVADSVRLQLASDVPFGCFLSGGLDSSTVAYWMSRHLDRPVQTYSVGFRESTFDEGRYARLVASAIGASHREWTLGEEEALRLVPRLVWHGEEITADSSMLAVYLLARQARQEVKMVLTGDGADEILAGYPTYPAAYLHGLYRRLPSWFRDRTVRPLVDRLGVSHDWLPISEKLRRFVHAASYPWPEAHGAWRLIFDSPRLRRLLAPALGPGGEIPEAVLLFREECERSGSSNRLDQALYADTRFYLPNDMLVKVDRMTMAHGLEARVPLLDHRVVEFAASLPPGLKLRRFHRGKYVLKYAMRGRLPPAILRRKKHGFNVPVSRWIAGPLKEFVLEHLSGRRLADLSFLDPGEVSTLLAEHFSLRADHGHGLWGLLQLSLWWRYFVNREAPPRLEEARRSV